MNSGGEPPGPLQRYKMMLSELAHRRTEKNMDDVPMPRKIEFLVLLAITKD